MFWNTFIQKIMLMQDNAFLLESHIFLVYCVSEPHTSSSLSSLIGSTEFDERIRNIMEDVYAETQKTVSVATMNIIFLPENKLNRGTVFPTELNACPVKTQISLSIRAVWSESLQGTLWVAMDL